MKFSTALLNTFTKNGGLLARFLASAIMAGLTLLIARLGFQLDAETSAQLAGVVLVLVQGFIGELVTQLQSNGIKAMQEAIKPLAPQVTADGTAGAVTLAAIKDVAAQASGTPAPPAAHVEVNLSTAQVADVRAQLDTQNPPA